MFWKCLVPRDPGLKMSNGITGSNCLIQCPKCAVSPKDIFDMVLQHKTFTDATYKRKTLWLTARYSFRFSAFSH